jgi:hypothetical protein
MAKTCFLVMVEPSMKNAPSKAPSNVREGVPV